MSLIIVKYHLINSTFQNIAFGVVVLVTGEKNEKGSW